MKKKIFSKLLMCLLVLSCTFVVSACGSIFQKAGTNIESIEILTNSVPEAIVVGGFDDAQIKAKVTYEDGTDETITITTEMVPESCRYLLNTPGIYDITIAFKGATTKARIHMVNSLNLYQVNFYDHNNQLINTQQVYEGEDAIAPQDFMIAQYGWIFLGWDRSYKNITEDTNIYAASLNVENALSDAKMEQALLQAEEYYMTHDNYTNIEWNWTDESDIITMEGFANYHYNSETQVSTSQISIGNAEARGIYIFGETEAEQFFYESSEGKEYNKFVYEEEKEVWDGEEGGPNFEQWLAASKLQGDAVFGTAFWLNCDAIEYGYEIVENKVIYTCIMTEYHGHDPAEYNHSIFVRYDDEKILQINESNIWYDNGMVIDKDVNTYNIEYKTVAFDENLIPNFGDINSDGTIDADDVAMIQQYIAGTVNLSEDQILIADVNLDNEVTSGDVDLIEAFIADQISYLPLSKDFVIDMFLNIMDNDMKGDIAITMSDKYGVSAIEQIDYADKIATVSDRVGDSIIYYEWESEDSLYQARVGGSCKKQDGLTISEYKDAEYVYMYVGYQMFYGGSYNGTTYQFGGLEFVDGNFELTINILEVDGTTVNDTIKYTFNMEHILSVENTYERVGIYAYDYSDITITLPEDVKALENSATEW